jgi:hypothetical protein
MVSAAKMAFSRQRQARNDGKVKGKIRLPDWVVPASGNLLEANLPIENAG